MSDFKSLVTRTAPTIASDAAGLFALLVMLIVGLHLPGFF